MVGVEIPSYGCNHGSPLSTSCRNPCYDPSCETRCEDTSCVFASCVHAVSACGAGETIRDMDREVYPPCIHNVKTHGSGAMTHYMEAIVYCSSASYVSSTTIVKAFEAIVNATCETHGFWTKDPVEVFDFIQYALHALSFAGNKILTEATKGNARQKRSNAQRVALEKKIVESSMDKLMNYARQIYLSDSLPYAAFVSVWDIYRFVSGGRQTYSSRIISKVWGVNVKPCIPFSHVHYHPLLAAAQIFKTTDCTMLQRMVEATGLDKTFGEGQAVRLYSAIRSCGLKDYPKFVGVIFTM
jgi:hypothetical protein